MIPAMPTNHSRLSRLSFHLQLSAFSLLLAGCNLLPEPQPDPTRHFTLSAPAGAAQPGGVVVRPVEIAGHLRPRAMAVRIADNEVTYREDVRWAEPLDAALTALLQAKLAAAPGEWSVKVEVSRFELLSHQGNAVQMAATYQLTPKGGAPKRGSFTAAPRAWDGRDHGALVALLRDAANELGDALAAAMN
jgi:uncharacterized lipoprotein YmbA